MNINKENIQIDCDRFVKHFWHPIIPVKNIGSNPIEISFVNELLVLWRSYDGKIFAHQNQCLHKTAKLSNGWVSSEGHLTCPYHGWEYAHDGSCVHIPQSVNRDKIQQVSVLKNYLCVEHAGYVWIAESPVLAPLPNIPEINDNRYNFYKQWPDEVWSTSPVRIIENDLDSSHIAFVHKNSFGDINHAKDPDLFDGLKETDFGFTGERLVKIKNTGLGPKVTGVSSLYTTRHTITSWYMPFTIKIDIRYPESGVSHVIYKSVVPLDHDRSLLVRWLFRNDDVFYCSLNDLISFERVIADEDKSILESTTATNCIGKSDVYEYNMKSDMPGNVVRNRLMRLYRSYEMEQQEPKKTS